MLAFDIQGFSRPDQRTRVTLRTALRDLLSQSLSSAGINWTQLEMADFGDGALCCWTRRSPRHDRCIRCSRSLHEAWRATTAPCLPQRGFAFGWPCTAVRSNAPGMGSSVRIWMWRFVC